MALLRRAPREVYRVFSESEFLADGNAADALEPVTTDVGGRLPLQRIAGAAMLLGAGVAVVALLLTHATPADRRLAPRAAVERARAPQRGPWGGEASVGRGLRERPRTARPRRRRAAPASANDASAATRLQPVDGSHDGAGISAARVERPEFSFER